MKRITLLTCFLCFSFFVNGQDLEISQEINDHIKARIEADMNVGIVVGLINGNDVTYFNYGKTASKNGTDVNENSVFEIGSASKVFTTILLAEKVKSGEMKLSDPISNYLPKTVKVPSRGDKLITLGDLATHTSALPRMPNNFAPADPSNPFADYSVEQIYSFLSSYELTRDIGSQYEYSNYGMGLLGHILELQSGKTFEQLVIDNIAKPLNMNNTSLALSENQLTNLAKGHMGSVEVSNWDIITLAGAGGIRSSTTDMVKFLQANMQEPKSDLQKAMRWSHESAFKSDSDGFEIGLGWHYENENKIVWHNGKTGGYASFIGFLKGTNKGVVVLTNSSESLTALGFKFLGGKTPLVKINKGISISTEVLQTYVGKYELAPSFFITITVNDGKLYGQATGQSAFQLFGSSKHKFDLRVVEASMTFNEAGDGTIKSLVLHQNGQNMPGKKIE